MLPIITSGALPTGIAVQIAEQKVREVLKIADRVYLLRNGRVSFIGPAADLQDDDVWRSRYRPAATPR